MLFYVAKILNFVVISNILAKKFKLFGSLFTSYNLITAKASPSLALPRAEESVVGQGRKSKNHATKIFVEIERSCKNVLLKLRSSTPFSAPMHGEASPISLRKQCFCIVKAVLSECERAAFAMQKLCF